MLQQQCNASLSRRVHDATVTGLELASSHFLHLEDGHMTPPPSVLTDFKWPPFFFCRSGRFIKVFPSSGHRVENSFLIMQRDAWREKRRRDVEGVIKKKRVFWDGQICHGMPRWSDHSFLYRRAQWGLCAAGPSWPPRSPQPSLQTSAHGTNALLFWGS